MLYQPRIKDEHIRTLYKLAKKEKRPMTHVVNEAITEYLKKETDHERIDSVYGSKCQI